MLTTELFEPSFAVERKVLQGEIVQLQGEVSLLKKLLDDAHSKNKILEEKSVSIQMNRIEAKDSTGNLAQLMS